ncbi:ParB N-terminal domain-containing protein [Chryseobacterium vrystaatense]|uniref:Uncharacterized protein n=1 Tax=Chryseobacterium vrystaatense TaxID=307480 RepID=A0A1M5HI84_9FLAO|nr:hypothetical protein [Chryseobacterium vrystaatense]KFF23313.1 hypothetical protein IW16_23810 [Chryseobacterium vrystaatense]SHG15684.1 hypothetical protein SAMN02787073_3712 [Chryseobacterium vrystaatense]
MKIHITHGQGIIKALYDGFASCLIIRRPVAVNWPDSRGSVGEYYAVSELAEKEKITLADGLNRSLTNGTEAEIMAGIEDFLTLFENGSYQVNLGKIPFDHSNFYMSEPLAADKNFPDCQKFSGWFYPFEDFNYLYTLERKSINPKRVDYYTELIKKGGQPKPIIFYSLYNQDPQMSNAFVLDGHHKIEAYKRLKMDIPAVFISKDNDSYSSASELMHGAHCILHDFEFDHLFQNNDENLPGINFVNDEVLTNALDKMLKESERIDTSIIEVLIRHHQSGSSEERRWLNRRLDFLKKNIHLSFFNFRKGLNVYIPQYAEGKKTSVWFLKTLRNTMELSTWIKETVLR